MLSFAYILPLILANTYYQDDILRASFGEEGWISDGRPLSALLMIILEGHYILADIAPLGLILSIVFLVCTGIFIANFMFPEDDAWKQRIIIASITCMSPFYLGNFSFRYDTLPMSITQCVAIFVPFISTKDQLQRLFFNFLALIFILCTYQSCLNTFIASSLLHSIIQARNKENINKNLFYFIQDVFCSLIISVIYAIIASHFITKHSYAGKHSGIIPLDSNFISVAFLNFISGFHLVNLVLSEPFAWIIAAIYSLGLFYNFQIFREKMYKSSAWNKFSCFFYMISPLLFLILIIGYTTFLRNPVFEPRTLVSVCILLYFSFFSFLQKLSSINRIWPQFTVVASFMLLFSYSYSYGNALRIHNESENTQANQIMFLLRLKGFQQNDTLIIMNKQIEPNIVMTAEHIHPLFSVLIRPILPSDGYFVPLILRQTVSFQGPWKNIRKHVQSSVEEIKTCKKIILAKLPIYQDDRILMYQNEKTWCIEQTSHLESFKNYSLD